MPAKPSRLLTVPLTRSRKASRSCNSAAAGAAKLFRMETGRPASLPGSIDGEIGAIAELLDARAVLRPVRQALAPEVGLLRGEGVGGHGFVAGVFLVDPGTEIFGAQGGEGEQQVREIALGVDEDGGNTVEGGLFEQAETEAGLSASRHADADRVRHQIFRVVEEQLVPRLLGADVVLAAEIERSQLLVILHAL